MVALERALGWSRQLRLTPLSTRSPTSLIKAMVALAHGRPGDRRGERRRRAQGKAEMPTHVWILSAVVDPGLHR